LSDNSRGRCLHPSSPDAASAISMVSVTSAAFIVVSSVRFTGSRDSSTSRMIASFSAAG